MSKTFENVIKILNSKNIDSTIVTYNVKDLIIRLTKILNDLEMPFIIDKSINCIYLYDKKIQLIENDAYTSNENHWIWKWKDEVDLIE